MRHRDEMEKIVKEYRAGGITQREIEAKYGIKHCTFLYWLYKGAAHAENNGETIDHEKKEKEFLLEKVRAADFDNDYDALLPWSEGIKDRIAEYREGKRRLFGLTPAQMA